MTNVAEPRPRLVFPISERDHVQGRDDAPVTLVEYGDYECPYCRLVYHDIQGLQEQLGDRLRYVYRHLPIESAHPHARLAAEAAEAVGWPLRHAAVRWQRADPVTLVEAGWEPLLSD